MWDRKQDGDEWSGGYILDPDNGTSYKCYVKVVENNEKLEVRGYPGFSLFGRTQTWMRTEYWNKPLQMSNMKRFRENKKTFSATEASHHAAQGEIRLLKETITALRNELEEQVVKREHKVQEAVATANDEIQQLRQTVSALREALEALQFEKDKAVQEVTTTSLDEIQDLKHNISTLREELEAQTLTHQQNVRDKRRAAHDEIGQLQLTILALRQELDGHTAKVTEERHGS